MNKKAESGTKTKRAAAPRKARGNPVKKAKPMGKARTRHGLCTLSDGRVLAIGGESGRGDVVRLKDCEIYDPSTDTWQACASLPEPRIWPALVALDEGRAMVIGGRAKDGFHHLADCLIWDPTTDVWQPSMAMAEKRGEPQVVQLRDGRLLVGGGDANRPLPLEIWSPKSAEWSTESDPVDCFLLLGMGGGDALVVGDTDPGKCWTWCAEVKALEAASDVPFAGRRGAGTALSDGRVMVAGGKGGSGLICEVGIFDPVSGSWQSASPLPQPRFGHRLQTLPDGVVLLLGGVDGDGVAPGVLCWDPAQDSWREVGKLKKGRRFTETVVLDDGSCLVVGGAVPGGALHSAHCERIVCV
ncbi:MAG: hypothetical protein JRH20_20030 [Deltaproteobacteria bacterium]|nr:hypothetical protein [Deltaproteobacteria bacterium]